MHPATTGCMMKPQVEGLFRDAGTTGAPHPERVITSATSRRR